MKDRGSNMGALIIDSIVLSLELYTTGLLKMSIIVSTLILAFHPFALEGYIAD